MGVSSDGVSQPGYEERMSGGASGEPGSYGLPASPSAVSACSQVLSDYFEFDGVAPLLLAQHLHGVHVKGIGSSILICIHADVMTLMAFDCFGIVDRPVLVVLIGDKCFAVAAHRPRHGHDLARRGCA